MAYDEDLAARIRTLIPAQADVSEKRMFGGLAFLNPEALGTERELERWVALGVSYARSLPPKR